MLGQVVDAVIDDGIFRTVVPRGEVVGGQARLPRHVFADVNACMVDSGNGRAGSVTSSATPP
jgi:hypothetical protein